MSQALDCKSVIEITKRKQDWCYFIECHTVLPGGEIKFFCELITEKMANSLASKWNLEIQFKD